MHIYIHLHTLTHALTHTHINNSLLLCNGSMYSLFVLWRIFI